MLCISLVAAAGYLMQLFWQQHLVEEMCIRDRRKGGLLVNIDSQAPNKAFGEFLRAGRVPGLPAPPLVRPESVWGDSRFDFYAEQGAGRFFLEVKGVTLEENGAALFPDAPTERGVKHLHELSRAAQEGFGAYAVFVLQMKGTVSYTHLDVYKRQTCIRSMGTAVPAMFPARSRKSSCCLLYTSRCV